MADFEFNVAKGRTGYYGGLPGANDALVVVLIQDAGIDDDDTLADYDTLAALLAANDEADFTGYERVTLANVAWTVDDVNNRADLDADDVSYPSAGGAVNNTLAKLVICYDPDTTSGTDADLIPLTAHDISATTDGTTLNIAFPAGGFYRAT